MPGTKPKKRILKRAGAFITKTIARGKAINCFRKGQYGLGVETLLRAGHPDIAKKMVEKRMEKYRKKIIKVAWEFESLGDVKPVYPLPDKCGTYTWQDWEQKSMFERTMELKDRMLEYRGHYLILKKLLNILKGLK